MSRSTSNIPLVVIAVFLVACGSNQKMASDPQGSSVQGDPQQWLDLANKSHERGSHQRALKAYEQVLIAEPNNIEALKGAAETLNEMEEYKDALDLTQQVLNLQPADVDSAILKSKILIRFGRFVEAEQMLLQIGENELVAGSWKLWNLLGIVSDFQEKYPEAILFYKKALKINGTEPDIYNNLGYSYIMDKQFDKAITYLHVGLQYNPSSGRLRNNLSIAYAWQKEYEKSLKVLLAFLPETEAYNNVAYIAMLNEDFKIAKKYYKEAIHYSPVYYRKASHNLEKLKVLKEKKRLEEQQAKAEEQSE